MRVVVHGTVKLSRETFEEKEILLDVLEPGKFFGSLSVLGDDTYKESAEAKTNSCVLSINLKEFREILQNINSSCKRKKAQMG